MTRQEAERQTRMLDALRKHGVATNDVWALRRISMTLQRWHELECGDSNNFASWAIERDGDEPDSKPYMVRWSHDRPKPSKTPIADRETGALKRLKAIMSRYPQLAYYVQGDPRGCALYVLRPSDVPEGSSLDSCYSRGVAVY